MGVAFFVFCCGAWSSLSLGMRGLRPLFCAAAHYQSNRGIKSVLTHSFCQLHRTLNKERAVKVKKKLILSVLGVFILIAVLALYLFYDPLLKYAAEHCENPAAIQLLVKFGAGVNAQEPGEETLLMRAAKRNNNPAVIEQLVRLGADVNAKTRWGHTALMKAASGNENPEVIERLVKLGADVNARNEHGETVLMEAVSYGKRIEGIELEIF